LKEIVLLLVAIVIALPILASCQNVPGTVESDEWVPGALVLDPVLELQIREDFQKYLVDTNGESDQWKDLEEIWVSKYYGNVSGCEVVFMRAILLLLDVEAISIEVAGYHIVFQGSREVSVYKDSEFYTLGEAYGLGIITKADVYNIGKRVDQNDYLGGSSFTERYPEPPR
jgi:hypothetical protein